MARIAIAICLTALAVGLCAEDRRQSEASKDDEEVYPIGGDVSAPKLIHTVEPSSPDTSKGVGVNGVVVIRMIVNSKGLPRDVRVVKSLDEDVDKCAVDAVTQWRFEPAKKKDRPVAVKLTVEIQFHTI